MMDYGMEIFEEICRIDKILGLQARLLKKKLDQTDKVLYARAGAYLNDYCQYHGIDASGAGDSVAKFNAKYIEDVKNFIETRKYPVDLKDEVYSISRNEYDIFLMSSFLFTEHRFSLLKELSAAEIINEKILNIGVGSGIELEFIKTDKSGLDACDLSIDDYPRERHKDVCFHEKDFNLITQRYDAIIAIEVLEHFPRPLDVISRVASVLDKNGMFILTIARNVPQFDHLYNFDSDDFFEKEIEKNSLKIEYKKTIPHKYNLFKIDAATVFYILKKTSGD